MAVNPVFSTAFLDLLLLNLGGLVAHGHVLLLNLGFDFSHARQRHKRTLGLVRASFAYHIGDQKLDFGKGASRRRFCYML
jgi:hypothetical protein